MVLIGGLHYPMVAYAVVLGLLAPVSQLVVLVDMY